MIYVNRAKVPIPSSLSDVGCKGEIETKDAIKHFSVKGVPYKAYKFKAYKTDDVRVALTNLFHDKCCYCESEITAVYYGDIEHFRPKAEIEYWKPKTKKPQIRPGYYRLSNNWENLLYSCKKCNSLNENKLPDGSKKVTGKGNYFPLVGQAKNLRHWNNISKEEGKRLLINPCIEDPELYFRFNETNGNIEVKTRLRNRIAKAETSIEILGLHRKSLRDPRLKFIKQIQLELERIIEGIYNLDNAKTQIAKDRFQNILDRDFNALKIRCLSENKYAAVARQLFNKFKKDYLK